jgi:hypothetical protein
MALSARVVAGPLDNRVSACALAAVLVEECLFKDHLSPAFGDDLRAVSQCEEREVAKWLDECAAICGEPDPTPAQTFFSLVLADQSFASQFQRASPASQGFDRHLRDYLDALDYRRTQEWDRTVGNAPTREDRVAAPNMARAVDRGKASAALVAEAHFGMGTFNSDQSSRGRYARFHPLILAAFERDQGSVVAEYWCRNFPAGMLRTERGRHLHLFVNEFPTDAIIISDRCEEVFRDIVGHLEDGERDLLAADIWAVLTGLYGDLDRSAASARPPRLKTEVLAEHRKRLRDTERQTHQGMRRRAQGWYILGTFLGVVVLAASFALLGLIATGNWSRLFEGAIFGAAGALASVLFRMQRGELRLNPRQGMKMIGTAALVRPLMGALFGGITVALLLSGLLPIEVTSTEPDRFYFLSSLAFVAGFTERWAPNLLQVAGSQANPEEKQDESPDGMPPEPG